MAYELRCESNKSQKMDQEKGKESKTRKHRSRGKECVAAECNSFECNSDGSVDLVYTFLNTVKEASTWKIRGAFHSTKNSGLNFRNFRMLNGTVFFTRPDQSRSIPA